MQEFNEFLIFIDQYLGSSSWFVPLLLGTGIFFTIYLKFPQIRYFGFALRVVRGKYDKKDDQGDTSHFQALTTALSGTVGTGNIAGVAFAIHLGGPAALFWMLVTAIVGMTTKFVEVTLSHKYREKISDGSMSGGPMYFMKNADFRLFGKKVDLKWVGIMFAFATVLSSFGTGSLPQINSISNSMFASFGIDKMITGGILAVLLGTVTVLSLALVVTRTSANVENFDRNLFYTTYKTIIRNTILACFLVVPLSALFGRNSIYVFIFLIGFVFNEMLHVALAYHQSKGDFVISSKQIIIRTILYGIGGWLIIYFKYSILWIIVFQTLILIIFYFVAHKSLPKESLPTENKYSTQDLTNSGRKMVLTTFSAALLSELDIVILGVFYSGPVSYTHLTLPTILLV